MASQHERSAAPSVTAHVVMTVAGHQLSGDITVPNAPVRLAEMLPVFQSLADAIIDASVQAVEEEGKLVSCCKGCGACCRQLVPISEVEARQIRILVERLPEPRRSAVRARFTEALRRLDEAGLLERLRQRAQWGRGGSSSIGLDYFAQRIACPFLEEESCSIHPERPIACREYLVTSPAVNCSHPTPEGIACVPVPTRIWPALALFDEVPPGQANIRWVPLILALEWAESHPEEPPPAPAPELLSTLIGRLTGSELSAPASLLAPLIPAAPPPNDTSATRPDEPMA